MKMKNPYWKMRVTDNDRRLLREIAKADRVDETKAVKLMIRDRARALGISIDPPVVDHPDQTTLDM